MNQAKPSALISQVPNHKNVGQEYVNKKLTSLQENKNKNKKIVRLCNTLLWCFIV